MGRKRGEKKEEEDMKHGKQEEKRRKQKESGRGNRRDMTADSRHVVKLNGCRSKQV